jgi:long-subunit acyl-CoA synthetase (AMP-forming)
VFVDRLINQRTTQLAALFLCTTCCCTFAPLSPALTQAELEYELRLYRCSHLVLAHDEARQLFEEAAGRLGITVVRLRRSETEAGAFELLPPSGGGGGDSNGSSLSSAAPENLGDGERPEQEAGGKGDADAGTDADAFDRVALLLHTSGTTSRPKTVPLTHGHLGTGKH